MLAWSVSTDIGAYGQAVMLICPTAGFAGRRGAPS